MRSRTSRRRCVVVRKDDIAAIAMQPMGARLAAELVVTVQGRDQDRLTIRPWQASELDRVGHELKKWWRDPT